VCTRVRRTHNVVFPFGYNWGGGLYVSFTRKSANNLFMETNYYVRPSGLCLNLLSKQIWNNIDFRVRYQKIATCGSRRSTRKDTSIGRIISDSCSCFLVRVCSSACCSCVCGSSMWRMRKKIPVQIRGNYTLAASRPYILSQNQRMM
jgi:hypothetical protein